MQPGQMPMGYPSASAAGTGQVPGMPGQMPQQWMGMQPGGFNPSMMQTAAAGNPAMMQGLMAAFQQGQGGPQMAFNPAMVQAMQQQAMQQQAMVGVAPQLAQPSPEVQAQNEALQRCCDSLSVVESDYYDYLWLNAGCVDVVDGFGNPSKILHGKAAFDFLSKSGLPREMLKRIWDLADWQKRHSLRWQEFVVAMKLISAAQKKQLVSLERVLENSSPNSRDCPEFEGVKNVSNYKSTTPSTSPAPEATPAPATSAAGAAALNLGSGDILGDALGSAAATPSVAPAASVAPPAPAVNLLGDEAATALVPQAGPLPSQGPTEHEHLGGKDGDWAAFSGGGGSPAGAASATTAGAVATTAASAGDWSAFGTDQPKSPSSPSQAAVGSSSGEGGGWADFGGFASSPPPETVAAPHTAQAAGLSPPAAPAAGILPPVHTSDASAKPAEVQDMGGASWADFGSTTPAAPSDGLGGVGGGFDIGGGSSAGGGGLWAKMSAFDDLLKEDEAMGGSINKNDLNEAFAAEAAANVASGVAPPPLVPPAPSASPSLLGNDDDEWGGFEKSDSSAPAPAFPEAAGGTTTASHGDFASFDAFGDFDSGAPPAAGNSIFGDFDSGAQPTAGDDTFGDFDSGVPQAAGDVTSIALAATTAPAAMPSPSGDMISDFGFGDDQSNAKLTAGVVAAQEPAVLSSTGMDDDFGFDFPEPSETAMPPSSGSKPPPLSAISSAANMLSKSSTISSAADTLSNSSISKAVDGASGASDWAAFDFDSTPSTVPASGGIPPVVADFAAFGDDASDGPAATSGGFSFQPPKEVSASSVPLPAPTATSVGGGELAFDDDFSADFGGFESSPPQPSEAPKTFENASASGGDATEDASWAAFGDSFHSAAPSVSSAGTLEPPSVPSLVGPPGSNKGIPVNALSAVPLLNAPGSTSIPTQVAESSLAFVRAPDKNDAAQAAKAKKEEKAAIAALPPLSPQEEDARSLAMALAGLGLLEEAERCQANGEVLRRVASAEARKKEAMAKEDFEGCIAIKSEINTISADLVADSDLEAWKQMVADGSRGDEAMDATAERLRQRCQYLDDIACKGALAAAVSNFRSASPSRDTLATAAADYCDLVTQLPCFVERQRRARLMSRVLEGLSPAKMFRILQVLFVSLGALAEMLAVCSERLRTLLAADWSSEDRELAKDAEEFQSLLRALEVLRRLHWRLGMSAELFLPKGGTDAPVEEDAIGNTAIDSLVTELREEVQAADNTRLREIHAKAGACLAEAKAAWSQIETSLQGLDLSLDPWNPDGCFEAGGCESTFSGSGRQHTQTTPFCALCMLPAAPLGSSEAACAASSNGPEGAASAFWSGGLWHVSCANFWIRHVASSKFLKDPVCESDLAP